MSFVNTEFFVFIAVALLCYYAMNLIKPLKKYQWTWLLIVSYAYYLSFGVKTAFFILYTTCTTYIGARIIGFFVSENKRKNIEPNASTSQYDKKELRKQLKIKKRIVVIFVLILNFGMLAIVKYGSFFIENINSLLRVTGNANQINVWTILLPVGISFYTFQSMGYMIDVYQEKYEPEKNLFKFALFVSFFPQIMQGPIGRFNKLATQLFDNHKFDLTRLEYALQLVGWGLFKKIVLADRAAVFVNQVFDNYIDYYGFSVIFAVLLYCIQLYADFSGGMDIVIGTASMFGIELDENFRQPFFSKSISEFWRRWHITLGTWMKDYVFYPFSLSKAMGKFSKLLKNHCNQYIGKTLPICLANLLIFFLVGVWHGAAWKFIVYGMYNGVIIAFSNLVEPLYKKCLKICHINSKSRGWKIIQILRTFILVNIGWYFDRALSLSAAFVMMKNTFINISISQIIDGSLYQMGLEQLDFVIILLGCLVWFIISLLKEKGIEVRKAISDMPLVLRWAIYMLLIFSTGIVGYTGSSSGFIYAQF